MIKHERIKGARNSITFDNQARDEGSLFLEAEINPRFKKTQGKCPSILIVDDQYINRFIIQQFGDKYGIPSLQAEDGQDAINALFEENTKAGCDGIELVLMDLNMPILDGIQAANKIKEYQNKNQLPISLKIVAVTAFPSESEKEKGFSAGMSKFFIKPFTITNFLNLVSL